MSEEKVIKHSKKILHKATESGTPWKQKLKGIAEEVFIIFLAVSITLILHNWNDHRIEREIEHEFLTGIKKDLDAGSNALASSIVGYQPTLDYYNNLWHQLETRHIDTAYVDGASDNLLNSSYFIFDDGRFEGFKSSGYLRLIENKELLGHLISLYSTYMPFERNADVNVFQHREQTYDTYIGVKAIPLGAGKIKLSRILNDPAVRFQVSKYRVYLEERKQHKLALVERMEKLSHEIDEELGEKH